MERKIYEKLLEWKEKNSKQPYMLIGARQTGKTYILKEFCKKEFENSIYINLENMPEIARIFEETIVPEKIIENIKAILGKEEYNPEKDVIFLDEIQISEKAITSLKYFSEAETKYKIVCAGSLLGVKINRLKSSFPVGNVWIEYMYPMDFEEFMLAIGEKTSLEIIKKSYEKFEPIKKPLHEKLLRLYQEYLCIGGMPAAINSYIAGGKNIYKFQEEILEQIITAYVADMSKYTQNMETIKNNKIYASIPEQLGRENKKFKYSIVDTSARKREYEGSLEWLLASNIILKCNDVKIPESPLKAYTSDKFKIYTSDVGLLRKLAGISINEILSDKSTMFKGAIAENYIAQTLYAKYKEIYYWTLENKYEIDFLKNEDGEIIPIEVKARDNTKSTSLNYYKERYKPKYSYRISTKNFGYENDIKSIPLYAAFLI